LRRERRIPLKWRPKDFHRVSAPPISAR